MSAAQLEDGARALPHQSCPAGTSSDPPANLFACPHARLGSHSVVSPQAFTGGVRVRVWPTGTPLALLAANARVGSTLLVSTLAILCSEVG